MASKFQETSHFERDSPPGSIHGAGGDAPARNSDDGSSVDHVQEKPAAAVPLTKRQKVKRHCGRFKWWYLGVGLIILIILLPLIFTKIIPAITQDIVNSQKLPIKTGVLQVVSPTQLYVTLETELDTPLAATLDPATLFVYNKDTADYSPFINITLPKIHANHKTPVTVTNQTVSVTNHTELVKWFDRIFDQPETDLTVKGKATVRLGALHMQSNIDKTIKISSLNGLDGFSIASLRLIYPAMEDGTNIKGTLNLPNAGIITLGLGNLTFDLFSGDIKLGYIDIYDVTLPHGNNTRAFTGQLYLNELVPNLGAILDSQSKALADGNIQLRTTGNATRVNGVRIPYIEEVLNNKNLIATVPVIKLVSDVISSFSGNNVSLSELLGDTVGNSTFIEGLLGHWNSTSTNTNGTALPMKLGRSTPHGSRTIKAPATKSLLKMGLKLALAKL
ncbi:hypothetical protein F5B22DRAFT_639005 [Xylaria bambusicola]|uniref:uncharacterized protein n=1 Tax=Xylaria bambusicola TaxID=326684 RepID=UPI002008616E|nr:uncharacterized protein F5B22DRAFT_639005 [Xylaria bambusicola]KAI0506765.1 hypothetical protein F5B22DRAFT_639005 [Xylaria bambusicola]